MREVYSATIEGVKPYLMHAFKGEESGAPKKKKGVVKTPDEECECALYRETDGTIYVPSLQLEGTMKKAATDFTLKGQKSMWELVSGGVIVEPEHIKIEPQTFKRFTIAGRIPPRTGGRVMISRPMFETWKLGFNVVLTDERAKGSDIKQILESAGKFKGIGDWHPRFGTFKITDWQKESS